MKKLLVGFISVVLLCGGLYMVTASTIRHVQRVAQWPEQKGAEAAKLCHTGETLKITITDNGGDTQEDFDCEDAQGQRRDVTEATDDKAPRLWKQQRVWVGMGVVTGGLVLAAVLVVQVWRNLGDDPNIP